jgi:hypothetical protein
MQAASRMAGEKRKRNMAASARFRARRKEKELEASTKIAILESQLRDAAEEIEWYKKERWELLTALQAFPGADRYLTREKSPRTRRLESRASNNSWAANISYLSLSVQVFPKLREVCGEAWTLFSLPPPPGSDLVRSSYYLHPFDHDLHYDFH